MQLFTIVFLVGAVGPIGYISSIFADHPPHRFSKLLPRVLQMASASSGVGIGGMSSVAPTFVSECSPKEVRGRITGLFQIMVRSLI